MIFIKKAFILNQLLALVDDAMKTYPAENISVDVNDDDKLIYVMYTSSNNSFPITHTNIDPNYIDKNLLIDELNARHIGYYL